MKKGASIGANATIVCGHSIGEYSMVGAGTVVTHDVGDYHLVVGNPDKFLGYVCRCGCRLDSSLECGNCESAYMLENGILKEKNKGVWRIWDMRW